MHELKFVAATQETTDGGRTWETTGSIEVVGTDDGATAAAVADDDSNVRVVVWENTTVEVDLAEPDLKITHRDLVDVGPTKRSMRRGRTLHPPRVSGPVSPVEIRYVAGFEPQAKARPARKVKPKAKRKVTRKTKIATVPASPELFRQFVLVSNDPGNRAGRTVFPGVSWHAARKPDGAIRACVTGYGGMKFQGREVFSLMTSVGEVRMRPGAPVIVDNP